MERILAISLTLFGDTLLSLPALVAIRKEIPAAKIGYLVGPSFHELFENQPFINDVIFANTPDHKDIDGVVKVWRLYRVIRNFSPDVAFIFAGYYFGNIPMVKSNFTMVIFAIIIISVLPGVIEFIRQRRINKK